MAAAKQLCFSVICVRNRRALVLAGEKRGPDFCLDRLFIKYTWVNEGDQNITRSAQLLRTVDSKQALPTYSVFHEHPRRVGEQPALHASSLANEAANLGTRYSAAGVIGQTRPNSSSVAATFSLYTISPGLIGTSDTTAKSATSYYPSLSSSAPSNCCTRMISLIKKRHQR